MKGAGTVLLALVERGVAERRARQRLSEYRRDDSSGA